MQFLCNICQSSTFSRRMLRDDGAGVLFCANCGMGMIEEVPQKTDHFYDDGYYGNDTGDQAGYHDYSLTSAHTQAWVSLMVGALRPQGGRILDVGCATGVLFSGLPATFKLFGIEVNGAAAAAASLHGITILGSDVADPRLANGNWGGFDVITSIATFEHVLDFRGAVTTCLNALEPDGVLIFEVPVISEVSHNRDWYGGSYEHIYYPTEHGMTNLFNSLAGIQWMGFENSMKGFSASYLGFATRSVETAARAKNLFKAMKNESLEGLNLEERRLNLAYQVVHRFQPNPERILSLPDLFDIMASPPLLRHMTQLWYADAVGAAAAQASAATIEKAQSDNTLYMEARDFWRAQANEWEKAAKAAEASQPAIKATGSNG